jgi:threonyl-tRNA synthetase
MERFIGILLENNNGYLPFLISPEHIMLCTLGEEHQSYAKKLAEQLEAQGVRVALDLRHRNLNLKIKEMLTKRIPILGVIGGREVESETVAVSLPYKGTIANKQTMNVAAIAELVRGEK